MKTLAGTALAAAASIGRTQPVSPPAGEPSAPPDQNVLFSAADPGHWEDWVSLHVPETTVEAGVLTVRTPHPQSDEHYIVSHQVILAGGTFLGRETFTPNQPPVSQHKLPAGYAGGVTVVSTCNRHDTWVKTLVV